MLFFLFDELDTKVLPFLGYTNKGSILTYIAISKKQLERGRGRKEGCIISMVDQTLANKSWFPPCSSIVHTHWSQSIHSYHLDVKCGQMTAFGQANRIWVKVTMCHFQPKYLGVYTCFYSQFLALSVLLLSQRNILVVAELTNEWSTLHMYCEENKIVHKILQINSHNLISLGPSTTTYISPDLSQMWWYFTLI